MCRAIDLRHHVMFIVCFALLSPALLALQLDDNNFLAAYVLALAYRSVAATSR